MPLSFLYQGDFVLEISKQIASNPCLYKKLNIALLLTKAKLFGWKRSQHRDITLLRNPGPHVIPKSCQIKVLKTIQTK